LGSGFSANPEQGLVGDVAFAPVVGVSGGRLCLVDLLNKACAPPFLACIGVSLRSWSASVARGIGYSHHRRLVSVVAGAERLSGAPAQLQKVRRWRPTPPDPWWIWPGGSRRQGPSISA
jgi:hypothetical protein